MKKENILQVRHIQRYTNSTLLMEMTALKHVQLTFPYGRFSKPHRLMDGRKINNAKQICMYLLTMLLLLDKLADANC